MSSLLAPLRTVHNTLLALVGWAEAGQSQQRSMEVTLLLQLARKTKGPMMRGAEYSGSILVTPSVEFMHCHGLPELYVHVAIKILKNAVYPWIPRDLPSDFQILKRLLYLSCSLFILYLMSERGVLRSTWISINSFISRTQKRVKNQETLLKT